LLAQRKVTKRKGTHLFFIKSVAASRCPALLD
jgi:hypothetical protein